MMDVGIYFDLRNPPPWRQDWARLYGFTLEMCEEAERLGVGSIWSSEHHLFEDGYLTQPVQFLSAVAARTKRARLGTAIMIASLRSAAQIAEETILVDLISAGRVELGLGAGYRVPEFQLFGADFATRFKTLDARALEVRELFTGGKLTPPPVQTPPPIWMGYQGPKGAKRAGRMGMRLLCPDANLWAPYKEGLVEGGHDPAIGHMGGLIWGWLTEDPDADWPVVARHYDYQINSYRRYGVEGTGLTPKLVNVEKVRWRGGDLRQSSFLHATPEDAAAVIKRYTAGAPVKHVHLFMSIAGMPEKMVARQVQLICTKLAPLLRS
jgi:alkanesulfonate monooxygenase SsuD/methylene tetrahydromethanopterin reductase-like flavin-dependent oxidoreductase (luciferase family)